MGDHEVPADKGMHRLGAKTVRLAIPELTLKGVVRFDVDRPMLAREPRHDAEIGRQGVQHLSAPGTGRPIAADVKGVHQDQAATRGFSRALENFPIVLLETRRRDGVRIAAQRPMEIVDADLDREPIGPVTQRVVLPAIAQVDDGVPADAFVEETDRAFGITRRDEVRRQLHVAVAERRLRAAASAIRDAVADEKNGLPVLKEEA